MTWTDQQILDTLRMIEASDYDEVRIESGDFKLHVRRNGVPATLGNTSAAPPSAVPPAVVAQSTSPGRAAAPANLPASSTLTTASSDEEAAPPGVNVVRAPMIGTFYRAPAPQSPPFVEAGAQVKAGDTICLVEVMKLFNTIKADVDGKVVRVLAQNAATVRKDQPLFWIEPSA